MLNGVKITELDLQMVKDYLRIDHEDDDVLLSTMLSAAKSFIQSYLKKKFTEFDEIPEEFTIACLALTSHWYEKREIQSEKASKDELSYVFSGLLDLHRNWN
ncbi:head-tail connector protein [Bacillus wiedmannii]|uniref:head-tail connector protein n=1 Tax=Bacillus wiedmannii TaxID=1890302 RepID=UPI000BF0DCCD|nr:head-tail connector protein [Bacillus wiedmannii]PEN61619.1 DNA-packaging protein [Bacillus wiedmannii]PHA62865.1 DNA-packaging protein [Bacillus wiedmannii]